MTTVVTVSPPAAQASPGTQVVFVTAYNQYAIDAFERGAVDYLLKPISPERLAATVARLKERIASGTNRADALATVVEQIRAHLPAAEPAREAMQWITASVGKETRLIMVDDVAYFQADNKYTVVMTAEGEALIRKLEESLGFERHHLYTHHPQVRRKVLTHAYAPSPG